MNQIHGHEVMNMMIESQTMYTKDSLTAEIVSRFGAETRFCTCSAQNLTAYELVALLDSKGKLLRRAGGITTDAELMCSHE